MILSSTKGMKFGNLVSIETEKTEQLSPVSKTKPEGVTLMIHNKLSYTIETKNLGTCKLFLQKSIEKDTK